MRLETQQLRLPVQAASSVKPSAVTSAASTSEVSSFSEALQSALKSVSQAQQESSQLQRSMQMEKDGTSIEQVMVSMQKSNVAFTAAVTVRNKLVSAYSDIMNMQV